MKKLAKYVSAVLICLFSSILLVACGEPTITKAYIKEGTIVTTVDRGSAKTALKLNEAIAVVEFSDGEKIEVNADKLVFGDIDLTTIGNDKVLKVKYGEFEFSVEIDVVKPHVTSAYIKAGTVNTSVVVGSPLVLTNAVAVVTYSNGEQIEVQAADLGFNMATLDLTTVGDDKPLKITYDSFEFYINIDVVSDPEDAIVRATNGIIEKGSIVDTVIEGATVADLGLDNATALITYDNGTSETVELNAANFTTTGLDLTTVGTKTVKVTYVYNAEKNLAIEFFVQITVNPVPEEQKLLLTAFDSDLLEEFKTNSGTQANKEIEFVTTGKTHLVGDDNALDFRINAKGIVDGNIVENLQGVKTEIVVKQNGAVLSATDYAKYVESTTYSSIDFKDAAVNQEFEVVVTATNYDPEGGYYDDQDKPTFTLNFKVVDGYNVYDAKGLSLFDNANIDGNWNTLKTAWGLDNVTTSALVLQNSIHITDADIPASHFYTEAEYNAMPNDKKEKTNQEIIGSLKDSAGNDTMIYVRNLKDGENFTVYGNYFDISVADKKDSRGNVVAEGLSRSVITEHGGPGVKVTDAGNSYMTTHTALFKAQGITNDGVICEDAAEHSSSTGNLFVNDTYFIGNAPRSMDPLCSGGILLLKAESVNLDVDNTINRDWFVGWMTELGWDQRGISSLTVDSADWENIVNNGTENNSHTNILNSKGYNNYSSLFYFWGTPNIVIGNSEFVGCGGPVIVCDQVVGDFENGDPRNFFNPNNGFGGYASEISIYNSKMESYVNGLEAWFATYNATAIFKDVAAANIAYTSVYEKSGGALAGSSFLRDYESIPNAMNMVACYKWGGESFSLSSAVFTRGFVRMFDTKDEYDNYNISTTTTYFGLDRSIVKHPQAGYVYCSNGGQKHQAGLAYETELYTQVALGGGTPSQDIFEIVRFENSRTGKTFAVGAEDQSHLNKPEDGDTACGYATLSGTNKTYLNGYLTNGFGVMIELFENPAANK